MSNTIQEGNNTASFTSPQQSDDGERLALAHLLRCRELQAPVLGTTDQVNISEAIGTPVAQAVYDTAQSLYDRDRQLPSDPGVYLVEVERFLRETDQWNNEAAEPLAEFVRWCFGTDAGTISDARGRELWSELIRARILATRLQTASTNVISSPAAMTTSMRGVSGLWDWLQAFECGELAQQLRSYSMAELFELARPPEWLVEPLIVGGANVYIGGPFKSIKSGLALELAVSQAVPATGGERVRFLGRFPCEPANHVLVFTGEANQWEVRQRIELIYQSKCILPGYGNRRCSGGTGRPTDDLNLGIVFEAPKMAVKEVQRIVRDRIREHGSTVVIFDPLYLCALVGGKGDAGNIFDMGIILRDMEQLVLDEGATPIFVHHFVKGIKPGTMPTLAHMAFSGSAERAAQRILLNHRVPFDSSNGHARLIMEVSGRFGQCGLYGVDVIEGRVEADFTGRRWQVNVSSLEEAQEGDRQAGHGGGGSAQRDREQERQESDSEVAEQILTHLRENPDGDTLSHMRSCVGVGGGRVQRAISLLLRERQIVRGPVRRQRQEYDGYLLADGDNGQPRQENNDED